MSVGISVDENGIDGRRDVLEQAMNLFWARGAEVASYNEIVEATGLSRKALYKLWPDKEAIVRDSLGHYREMLLTMVTSSLAQGGQAGLTAFWNELQGAARQPEWRGCYLFRTASGPMRHLDFVIDNFDSYLDALNEAFVQAIIAGQIEGSIGSEIAPSRAGLQAVALIGMISAIGAQDGYSDRVETLFKAGRESCGLSG